MTFNLHEDQPPDSPNSWEKRRDLCISVITSYSPMILCTQQGLSSSPYTRLYMNVCVCCSVDLGRACFLIEMVDLGLHWPVFWRWVFLLLGCGSIFLLKCLASEQRFGWMMFLIEEFLILTLLNHTPFEWWTGLGFSNLFFGGASFASYSLSWVYFHKYWWFGFSFFKLISYIFFLSFVQDCNPNWIIFSRACQVTFLLSHELLL